MLVKISSVPYTISALKMSTHAEKVQEVEQRLFGPEVDEDPWTRTRTVPMEVLNMSVPRTGSMCSTVLHHTGHHSSGNIAV